MYKLCGMDIAPRVPLVFDLGDRTAVKLDQSVLDRIKAVPIDKTTGEVGLKGHVIEIPTYTVPLMRIGTAEFRNVIAQLSKYDPAYTPRKIGNQGALVTGSSNPKKSCSTVPIGL